MSALRPRRAQLRLFEGAVLEDEEARRRWKADGVRGPWAGRCGACRRSRGANGRVILVARHRGAAVCLDCWLAGR